ncbi:hypothetical protein [Shewanella waksmanii]|uniref:hypothetical protein n=1 Tax=Shewanella waksmanii TaxID=213783 RepID=UPI00048C6BC6|nr:hypothetical protein [Shewanella waksmanii]
MTISKMFKVVIVGLGLGAAVTAYAFNPSCSQCNRAWEACLVSGDKTPMQCSNEFRACARQVPGSCNYY